MMKLISESVGKLQTGFSCCYKKELSLLALRSKIGLTLIGT